MGHVGIICPNTPGHLIAMVALADATRARGHRVTFFLLGDPPASVAAAGFETVALGGAVFPPDQYRTEFQRLGLLQGRAALKHTLSIAAARRRCDPGGRADCRSRSWCDGSGGRSSLVSWWNGG